MFVPGENGNEEKVLDIINKEDTLLLVSVRLFDVFTKNREEDPITSYAYRLVFQSFDRTLTDDEVNKIMATITVKMNEKEGWQVR